MLRYDTGEGRTQGSISKGYETCPRVDAWQDGCGVGMLIVPSLSSMVLSCQVASSQIIALVVYE